MKRLLLIIIFTSCIISAQKDYPSWARGIVWYQIFPERFENGDPSNDPDAAKTFTWSDNPPLERWRISEWTSNWFEPEEWNKNEDGSIRDFYRRRYGGDIQGIIDKLDYIQSLGVNAIYLNPVFESMSLHKYDATLYHHIDVNFGPNPEFDKELISTENPQNPENWKWTSADSLFLKLIADVHSRGMQIIIDGVFNHVGTKFWAFQDVLKNQQKSEYADWFMIKSFDDPTTEENEFDYKGWWDIKSLPQFARSDSNLAPGPARHIFDVVKRWMDPNGDGDSSDGVDGWRLDVARDVPLGFWQDFREVVKSVNPDAIIIGELWELSPDFVGADKPFDALMNYEFAFAVNDYLIADTNRISTSGFVERLKLIQETYPLKNRLLLQNLLDSHDTDRLTSMIKNPDRKFDHDASAGNSNYDPSKPDSADYEMMMFITAFQMLYTGSPMIYYGDEVGMWGADDPHCRKPMIWNDLEYDDEVIDERSGFKKGFGRYTVEQNFELLNFYKNIISLRDEYQSILLGNSEFIYQDDNFDIFAFTRIYNGEKVTAVFNSGDSTHVLFSNDIQFTSYSELIYSLHDGDISDGKIYLPPKSVILFK